jgi:UDP:flavonoid glycosyltransferase YjiC (YdhE family)
MHITILALGSHGDVLPFVTLGKGLKTVGHQIRLVTFENFREMTEAHGLDFWPIQGDSQVILNAGRGLALSESGQNVIRMWYTVVRAFGGLARTAARNASALMDYKTDLIINQLPGGLYGYDLAQKLNVPMLMGAVMPLTPTAAFPMLGFPQKLALIPGYNRFSYRLAQQMIWQCYRPAINEWRKRALGLPKWPISGYFERLEQEKIPVLNGFSQHIVPRPPDWGDHIHITGYWFPEAKNWQPPDNLCEFIEAGPPPVFIGFGSMPVRNRADVTRVVLAALEQTGQRGILHTGWAGVGDETLPDYVFKIDYAAYEWLFPRMAMVIHHGGSGTTAFGLRAGVPSLIVPFLFDQFYWGKRIFELGLGPKPIPFKELTTARLTQAILTATTDAEMRRKTAVAGNRISQEAGLLQAVTLIGRYQV